MNPEGLPAVGDTLTAKYQITRLLGRGGMGAVYEATHLRLGHQVAIKVVLPAVARRPEIAYRFEHEGRAAARLRGRHTVRVLDVDATPEGLPFLVMELLEGHSLRDELLGRGPLPIEDAVRYVREACEGVDEVHRAGIIHRDIKPANLFLSVEAGGSIVKVVDFGIAKAHGDGDASYETATHVALGTCKYMSPEQAQSARSVDVRTDIWSLGVTLYELLAGRAPFLGEGPLGVTYAIATQPPSSLRALRPEVPEALTAIIERALCKNVAGRHQTVRELSDELAPFDGRGALLPPRPPSRPGFTLLPEPAPPPATLRPALAPDRAALREPLTPSLEPAAARRPHPIFLDDVPNESVTSGSKSHVVPIPPATPTAGLLTVPPWLVRGTMAMLVVGGIAIGFKVTPSRQALTSLAASAPFEQAPPASSVANPIPATAVSALTAQARPGGGEDQTSRSPKNLPGLAGEKAKKLTADATHESAKRLVTRSLQSKPSEGKTVPEPVRGPANPTPPKPQKPEERHDIERFDAP